MKTLFKLYFLGALLSTPALADTPSGTRVVSKTFTGDGLTEITATGSSLNVDVTNALIASITSSALPANACQETGGHLASIDGKLTSPLSVTGTVAATNSANGLTGATAPAQATSVGGTDATGKLQPLSVSASGVLSVDASGHSIPVTGNFWQATQPVSGTFWQATQPVSGTVTANAGTGTMLTDGSAHTQPVSGTFWQATQPVSGTFWQATQPISAASLPLPTGAALSSKQPGLGVAGTPSADVLTVQGSGSMTPLLTDGSATVQPVSGTFWQATQPVSGAVTANVGTTGGLALDSTLAGLQIAQGSTTAGQSGPLSLGAVTTASPTYVTGKSNPLSLTTGGALRVDGSASTQPVSGTFWQATQPVSGTVAVSSLPAIPTGANTIGAVNVNGTVPVSGTFWQTTQPVSGTITANVGTTGGLALDASVNGLLLGQNSTTSGQTGPLAQAAVTTAAPTYGTGKTQPLSMTTVGALRVDNSGVTQPVSGTITANAGTGTMLTDSSAHTQPVSGTFWQATQPVSVATLPALPANQSVNTAQVNGNTVSTGNGVSGTGVQRVAIASDNSAISTKAPVNANGALSARQTVTTTESTVAAPANAVAFVLVAESGNADNIRWGLSSSATAILSSSLGMLTEPGRSYENVQAGTGVYLHLIATGGGTDFADVQWVLSQ